MVLELLKYAKSAIKIFRPIRGNHCGHVTSKEGFRWVKNFLSQITNLAYMRNSKTPGHFSIRALFQKKISENLGV